VRNTGGPVLYAAFDPTAQFEGLKQWTIGDSKRESPRLSFAAERRIWQHRRAAWRQGAVGNIARIAAVGIAHLSERHARTVRATVK